MPIVSKAQQGYLFANKPELAKRWAKETPDFKSLPEHVKKHIAKREVKKHTGKGGPMDSQTKDVGNLGKFTPTASTLSTVRQQAKKPLMPKTPLQAIGYPINQAKRDIIRKKSSYKEYNMSGVNPSFRPRTGGFTKQPTGNSYLN